MKSLPTPSAMLASTHSHALARATLLVMACLGSYQISCAADFGNFELSGFVKEEFSLCDNCTRGFANSSSYDPRGVLDNSPNPPVNLPEDPANHGSNLGLVMATAGYHYEFDNAVTVLARASGRERNNQPDIYGQYLIDGYVGASHPQYGSINVGTLSTRSWTRTDAFSYPVGLSTSWAESGAGYSVIPRAIRLATKEIALPIGKIRFEITSGTASKQNPLNAQSSVVAPPRPTLTEGFIQYSNDHHLIELIYQQSSGAVQSSFSKGALFGSQGSTNASDPTYRTPHEDVTILEGNYYPNPVWQVTYGIKRSEWSGQQQQCDYSSAKAVCYFDQAGFNYDNQGQAHHAIEWDAFGGVLYHHGLWTATGAITRMNKAYVATPVEWGQDNTATFVNLGIYRKMPEVYKNFEIYTGIGRVFYGGQYPAPLSMPSNLADGAVDPRVSRSGNSITIGANLLF